MRHAHPGLCIVLAVALAVCAGCDAGRPADNLPEQTGPLASQADHVHDGLLFVHGYLPGYEQAWANGKPMLVFFTARGCGYCQQMVKEASADAEVVRLSQDFVCILVEADSEPEICREFRVRGYPTVQFMSPRGVPLNRLMGKTPARRLAAQMQAALQATASQTQRVGHSTVR